MVATKTEPFAIAHGMPRPCLKGRLQAVLGLECDAAKRAAALRDEAADAAALQAALKKQQHPVDCSAALSSGAVRTFKDWRNGLGAQISSLVGAWTSVLAKNVQSSGRVWPGPRAGFLLIPLGGLRYANKALCPRRDLSCYFEPFAGCAAPASTKSMRAKKTPEELAGQVSRELRLRRPRDKWWLRKELTR